MIFKFGELFSGPGGLSLGALNSKVLNKRGEVFKLEHAWASDCDADSCKTYVQNIEGAHNNSVYISDVKDLDIKSLENIDSFAYGFPCNDFSIVGEQKGMNGNFGGLYTFGLTVLNEFQPKFFVAENVGGLSSSNSGMAFKKILNDLYKCSNFGYNLTVHKYKSEEYGVPQTRHRIIIVGIRNDLHLTFKVPAPTTPKPSDYKTAREALEVPPITEGFPNHIFTKQS
ncbi:MAG: DNA (cytosine-5-)-methyltransferase, partial [Candidatus Paceibacterota bacterium]